MVAWYKKDTDLLPASHTNIENVNNRGGGGAGKAESKVRKGQLSK